MLSSFPTTSPFKSHFCPSASSIHQSIFLSFPSSLSLLMSHSCSLVPWHSVLFFWTMAVTHLSEYASVMPQWDKFWEKRSSYSFGESETSNHASRCLSFGLVLPDSVQPSSQELACHRPRSALLNPYPDSLGLKTDLFSHRDTKHTSVFLSDAQTND